MAVDNNIIKKEIVLRVMHLDTSTKLSRRALVRWIALSLGLISPNESRSGFLVVFEKLLFDFFNEHVTDIDDLLDYAKSRGISSKTVYYHLGRMKKRGLLAKLKGGYVFGDGFEKSFVKIVERKINSDVEEFLAKLKEAVNSLKSSGPS